MNKLSKTHRKQTNIDIEIIPQQKHHLGTISNILLGRLKPVLRDHNPHPWFCCGTYTYKLFGPREGFLTDRCIKTANILLKNTEMKQDEYSTARPTLKRWSNRNLRVQPWWARPKTQCIEPQATWLHVLRPEPSLSPKIRVAVGPDNSCFDYGHLLDVLVRVRKFDCIGFWSLPFHLVCNSYNHMFRENTSFDNIITIWASS